ncbi:MAG TPA: antibiotic biosynthesis monooxygenase [Candidatus Corynebacterium gallistercoris]|uniref:Antibiotic biosynthesis monooxygenase n=1 Tax=Candidatus Corynebacterium gallistercoris TaxID=2838530 RepID=A0A9D1UPF2_9CORY|nr:antibiotic biosynthesis monooxygenase [Candidatus Corynebacterium gallistercoris]
MILINVKYQVKPECADTFLKDVQWFTEATRAEEGNIFFDWFRSEDDRNEFILVEAFQDDAAEAHVNSDHFKRACDEMPKYLQQTPQIINTEIPGKTEWDEMAEFKVEN